MEGAGEPDAGRSPHAPADPIRQGLTTSLGASRLHLDSEGQQQSTEKDTALWSRQTCIHMLALALAGFETWDQLPNCSLTPFLQ